MLKPILLVSSGLAIAALALTAAIWFEWSPTSHRFNTGVVDGFTLGETKENLLRKWPEPKARIIAGNRRVDPSNLADDARALLLSASEWKVENDKWSPCFSEQKYCGAATFSFAQDELSQIQLECHRCP